MKTNKFLLEGTKNNEVCKQMESCINVKNSTIFYSISRIFNISSLANISLCFIERCFPMVTESKNFLELDFIQVGKIILSSELNVDSELQVVNAVDEWLCHNITERNKFAKDLLLKIRISLLSDPTLNYILKSKSSFNTNAECVGIIKNVLENKKESHSNIFKTFSRYCNQDKFNIIICGGRDVYTNHVVNDVYSVNADNFNSVRNLAPMREGRHEFDAVCIQGDVYVFGGKGIHHDCITSVEKYSHSTKSWEKVLDMYDSRRCYNACSFMDDVYITGGRLRGYTNSCVKFNTKYQSWKKVSPMNEARRYTACAVFNGRVVVSGGYTNNGTLTTVETYDHVADSWSYMSNMIHARFLHKSVTVKNKLFVVGGWLNRSCEVYDSTSNKFVLLKPPPVSFMTMGSLRDLVQVILIGSKLVVFINKTTSVFFYDVETDEWSHETCEVTRNLRGYCCAKVPQL